MEKKAKQARHKELPFEAKREQIAEFLADSSNAIMALATGARDRILARMVLVTCEGLDVYFFTWRGSRKCDQIRANPRVALCKGRVQIEGTAQILGELFGPSNTPIRRLFEERFPETIERWKDRPGMVLVKVTPTSVVLAGEAGGEPRLEFVDLVGRRAYDEPWADR